MAEAFIQVLIKNLSSLIEGEIGLILGVNKEMKKLSNTLTTIQKVLEDAEDRQFQSNAIQIWLSRLSDIAYEIEDILDECVTEVSTLKKNKGSRFNLKNIVYNYKIGRRIKKAVEELEGVAAERHNFHFREIIVQETSQIDWRRDTGPIVNDPDHIYGRDEDKEKIVDVLVNQVANCDQLSVLPIIGVGGLGKTTLAQLVYNDERVSARFDTKLWVCVSDNFDLKILVKAMIEFDTGRATDLVQFVALECRLRDMLNNRKFLLILDDVRNDNQEDWVKLKSILSFGSKGSVVVVTTRQEKVAEMMRTHPIHRLKELTEEHCWLLFKLRAFGLENEQHHHHHPNLESIGRQIVKKCAGVPLAAKALGGLLRFKREENEWIRVNESEIWNLSEAEENSILWVLRLSYRHLSFVLKRCFVYCAIFPKDFVIKKQDLIFRWMAHGCISTDETQELEDVGDQIWNELVLRSFFQQVDTSGKQTTFKMHDLVHDLARSIMEKKVVGAEIKGSSTSVSNNKIREVYWGRYPDQTSSSRIRLQVSTPNTIMNYKRLRTLKLRSMKKEDLPSGIGKLKHLRYLDLSGSSIHTLPHTFCSLSNLQTLFLNHCYSLKCLPKNIRCMSNLRHIFLDQCWQLSHMPSGIRELTSLKTLSLFVVGDKLGNQLDELENLNLGGTLEIKHLERAKNHVDAKKANLIEKPNLRRLILGWEDKITSSKLANMMDDDKVLEALKPHLKLETLEIYGFKGEKFPLWMTKMENLTSIFIYNNQNCSRLPPLGDLPRLRSLKLRNLAALEYMNGEDEIGGQHLVFQSLELLELNSLPNLRGLLKKELEKIMFPKLTTLAVENCPNCWRLPPLEGLPRLRSLLLRNVDALEYMDGEDENEGQSSVFPSLEVMILENLSNLKGLLKKQVGRMTFPNLARMEIKDCPKCSCLPPLGGLPRLQSLRLVNVDALEYVDGEDETGAQNSIFLSLKLLKLKRLPNLKGLLKKEAGKMMLPNLEILSIKDCESLILPPLSLFALKELSVGKCSVLSSLDNISEDALQGFCNLKILNMANVECLPENWFRGLKSLRKLGLYDSKIGNGFVEGWLRHLIALEELTIQSCSGLVTALEEIQYLRLLKRLSLNRVEEMVSLPQGLQHIPTLQSLSLSQLGELTSLPDWLGNLMSLTHLYITDCPKLPLLPSTIKRIINLKSLSIEGCPQLKRRCEKEMGEDWHIIAHIPKLHLHS